MFSLLSRAFRRRERSLPRGSTLVVLGGADRPRGRGRARLALAPSGRHVSGETTLRVILDTRRGEIISSFPRGSAKKVNTNSGPRLSACSFSSEFSSNFFMINTILENTFLKFVEHVITTFVICDVFVAICLFLLQNLL
ncbi:hypothetical protein NP493_242g02029 [Ridgeia piscesae]|uniref:Uncharacterized protein n=1 Tax=Ridgeia piscesae TaxID=27915 RepID=A0AAD9UD04_RIDPI|nr:hypothetical protein NP493_242g02029 [Ridgeia piscesae]